MTPHYLAELLRARCAKLGNYCWHSESDAAVIDAWNNTDADSDQEKLTPRQLSKAIARCETLDEFETIIRCPALVDGGYLMFRPGKSAVLTTLLDKRYFIPPLSVSEMVELAAEQDDFDYYMIYKKIIRKECKRFFQQQQVADFDILLTYYYWSDE